ncbi:lipid II flippase family protein [Acinetobacter lwoffii]|uniref:lipid II flippase family protein n=1 Tax=Acinetobacter TaxID=469 RepID=UPI003A8AA91A
MIYIVPVLFGLIHLIEFSSYLSRVAGLRVGYPMLGYSFQQMFFVGTRFLFIALMPLIGFLVDSKISANDYIYMLFLSMLSATLAYFLVFFFKEKIINIMSLLILRKIDAKIDSIFQNDIIYRNIILNNKKTIFLSAIVFCSYSLGAFIAFYFALIFYDYRTTISQMSGVVNGFATVLLTFIIEPMLAKKFDERDEQTVEILYSVLMGRFLGVCLCSQIIILILWLIS